MYVTELDLKWKVLIHRKGLVVLVNLVKWKNDFHLLASIMVCCLGENTGSGILRKDTLSLYFTSFGSIIAIKIVT